MHTPPTAPLVIRLTPLQLESHFLGTILLGKWKGKSRSTVAPPQLFFDEIAGFKTSALPVVSIS